MPPKAWQPPLTGDLILDRCFAELSGRLSDMSVQIDDLDAPQTRVVSRLTTLVDERFVEWRGGAGEIILPDARYRGTARAGMVTIQNTGIGALTVRAAPRNTVNGLVSWPVPMASATIFTANGVDQWSAAGAASPTPSGGGETLIPGTGLILPGVWYPPGLQLSSTLGTLGYTAPTMEILYAIPTAFPRAGTLTDVASHESGNGGGSTKQYLAIYRSNAAKNAPDARIWSGEVVGANFTPLKYEFNSLGLTVDAGEVLWFASVGSPAGSTGPSTLSIPPSLLQYVLGTNYNGSGGAAPLRTYQVGYAEPFSYAQPPDPWTGATIMLATDYAANGAGTFLYKFSPA